jgi:hypothetical protein
MTKHHFSLQEVFMFGWSKTVQHAWFIVLTAVIASIISGAVKFIPIINSLVCAFIGISIVSISLLISRNQDFSFRDLYMPVLSQKRVLKFIALTILYAFLIVVCLAPFSIVITAAYMGNKSIAIFGLLLSVLTLLPGIYLSVRLKFFPFIVVEHENASIPDLIKMSYKLTSRHFLPIFLFIIAASILNIIGVLFFFVGVFLTFPVTVFASAHMYNKLKDHQI